MLFNSIHFIIFFPIVFAIYWLMAPKYRWAVLLVASYYFYLSWSSWFGILLAGTTLVDYFVAIAISNEENNKVKRRWLLISLVSNLGCLFSFKYFAFFYNSSISFLNAVSEQQHDFISRIIIPVGLSFYTFQSLSYVMDVYRGKAIPEGNLGRFGAYVSFFPQLVAGPIERFNHLMPQFYEKHKLTFNKVFSACKIITWGYFKKMVIADRLAEYVDPVFGNPHQYSGISLLVMGFFFVVQVYCDFSGYSDIATGLARLLGFELMLNWRRPLLSGSLHEFWQRNHISLTSWFRDYVYISLGGSRVSPNRHLINIFLVFVLSGIWHGSNWTFLIWGAMHGLAYIIEFLVRKRMTGLKKIMGLGWIALILFHTISLIAFRANSVHELGLIYQKIFSFDWSLWNLSSELTPIHSLFPLLIVSGLIVFLFLKEGNEEYAWLNKLQGYNAVLKPVFYLLIVVMIFILGRFNSNEFIYFHF